MARHAWFKHYVGKATIASPDVWESLAKEWGTFSLTEHNDGTVLTERVTHPRPRG